MASVSEYLKKLLYQYDCVVVPELGAFLTHYQPASFTETSGLYLPPRKRVAFNEALRLDDGILANYIMLHESVTREAAQKTIGSFVGELHRQVAQTDRFELDGIGSFTRNEEGSLQFDPSLRHNFFGESYGMSAISAQTVNRQLQREPVLDAVPVTALGPVLVRDDDTVLTPLRRSRPYWQIAAAALLVGSLGVVSYFSVVDPDQSLQSSLDPANLLRIPASFFARPADTKATLKPVRKPAVHVMPPAATVPVKPAIATPEQVAEPAPVTAPVSKPASGVMAPIVTAQPTRTESYFTVIAGSFASKRNALRLRRHLRKAGYTDAYVIFPMQKGQLYKVAAAGSAIRTEAVARMDSVGKIAGTEAWIFKN